MEADKKRYWRTHIMENYPNYEQNNISGILDYCKADVVLTEKLFLKQVDLLEKLAHNFTRVLQQAIFQGRSLGLADQIAGTGSTVM